MAEADEPNMPILINGEEPEEIIGIDLDNNKQLRVLIKFKDQKYPKFVPSSEVNEQAPQMIIAFYEKRIYFKPIMETSKLNDITNNINNLRD